MTEFLTTSINNSITVAQQIMTGTLRILLSNMNVYNNWMNKLKLDYTRYIDPITNTFFMFCVKYKPQYGSLRMDEIVRKHELPAPNITNIIEFVFHESRVEGPICHYNFLAYLFSRNIIWNSLAGSLCFLITCFSSSHHFSILYNIIFNQIWYVMLLFFALNKITSLIVVTWK